MMSDEEISKIKEHIEIHAEREPRAIKITATLRKAVSELERIAELEKENEELRKVAEYQQATSMNRYFRNKALDENLIIAKSLIRRLIDRCCRNGAAGRLTADAEQFLREVM